AWSPARASSGEEAAPVGTRAARAGPWQPSDVLDAQDLVGAAAARGRHLDALAFFLADQGTRQRRAQVQLAGVDIRLGLADDLVDLLLVGVLVDDPDRRAETNGVAREPGDIDDIRPAEQVLELRDPPLDEALALA